jgi:hypothetical protein
VGTAVTLRYPNGRTHDATLDRELRPGDQFELYGRRWVAVNSRQGRTRTNAVRRVLCVPAEAASP